MDNTPFARILGPHDGMELGHEYILVVMPVDGHFGYKWYAFDVESNVVCSGEADDPIETFANAKDEIRTYDHEKCRKTVRSRCYEGTKRADSEEQEWTDDINRW